MVYPHGIGLAHSAEALSRAPHSSPRTTMKGLKIIGRSRRSYSGTNIEPAANESARLREQVSKLWAALVRLDQPLLALLCGLFWKEPGHEARCQRRREGDPQGIPWPTRRHHAFLDQSCNDPTCMAVASSDDAGHLGTR